MQQNLLSTEESEDNASKSMSIFGNHPLSLSRWADYENNGTKRTEFQRIVVHLFVMEYALVPVFSWLGYDHFIRVTQVLQLIFVVGSFFIQWRIVSICDLYFTTFIGPEEILESVGPLPVKFLGIKKRWYYAVTLSPNYAHVHATAVLVGVSWSRWTPEMQARFYHTWENTALLGPWIGSHGLPTLMSLLMVYSFIIHAFLVSIVKIGRDGMDRLLEPANLMFAGKVLKEKSITVFDQRHENLCRGVIGVFVKSLFIWSKTSWLAIGYEELNEAEIMQAVIAIGLAWLSCTPVFLVASFFVGKVLKDFTEIEHKAWTDFCCTLALLLLVLIFMSPFLKESGHFMGIWYCDSHDFSLVHGCTSPYNTTVQ